MWVCVCTISKSLHTYTIYTCINIIKYVFFDILFKIKIKVKITNFTVKQHHIISCVPNIISQIYHIK